MCKQVSHFSLCLSLNSFPAVCSDQFQCVSFYFILSTIIPLKPICFFNERPRWSGYRWTGSEGELGGVERENVNQNLLCEKKYFS